MPFSNGVSRVINTYKVCKNSMGTPPLIHSAQQINILDPSGGILNNIGSN
jgi:hypothetical protein